MKNLIFILFFYINSQISSSQFGPIEIGLQLGFETSKYVSDWSQFSMIPVEFSALVFFPKYPFITPKISIGTGNYTIHKNNYSFAVAGNYFKPGIDFYLKSKAKNWHGIISGNLIFGQYRFLNTILISNPVWGDYKSKENMRGNINGYELGIGFAYLIKNKVELKVLVGGRAPIDETLPFTRSIRGIIPGYGFANLNYSGSMASNIFLSYRL